ncbi:hypothetical protein [Sphingobium sp.]|uniref:hypothetical protein n=1 Tax=Sphingobium sp. TaxID=1912891 RepID=UPI0028BD29A5|nr:hypothetical protein [Sphingobium sp.]
MAPARAVVQLGMKYSRFTLDLERALVGVKVDCVSAKIAGNWPSSRWDELMPWNWRPDQQPIAEAA